MKPLLFTDPSETAFQRYDAIELQDCISCNVTEDGKGLFELEMEYPMDGRDINSIKIGAWIVVPTTPKNCTLNIRTDFDEPFKDMGWHPFFITGFHVDTEGIIVFTAYHITYKLDRRILRPQSTDIMSGEGERTAQEAAARVIARGLTRNDTYIFNEQFYGPSKFTYSFADGTNTTVMSLDRPRSWRDFAITGSDSFINTYDYYVAYPHSAGSLQVHIYFWPMDEQARVSEGLPSLDKGKILYKGQDFMSYKYEYDAADRVSYVIPYANGSDGIVDLLTAPGTYQNTSYTDTVGVNKNRGYFKRISNSDSSPENAVPCDAGEYISNSVTKSRLFNAGVRAYKIAGYNTAYENLTIALTKKSRELSGNVNEINLDDLEIMEIVTVVIPEIHVTKKLRLVKSVFDVLLERWDALEFGSIQSTVFNVSISAGTQQMGNSDIAEIIVPPGEGEIDIDPTPDILDD